MTSSSYGQLPALPDLPASELAEPLFEIVIEADVVPAGVSPLLLGTGGVAGLAMLGVDNAASAANSGIGSAADLPGRPNLRPTPPPLRLEPLGATLGPSSIQNSVYSGVLSLVKLTALVAVAVALSVIAYTQWQKLEYPGELASRNGNGRVGADNGGPVGIRLQSGDAPKGATPTETAGAEVVTPDASASPVAEPIAPEPGELTPEREEPVAAGEVATDPLTEVDPTSAPPEDAVATTAGAEAGAGTGVEPEPIVDVVEVPVPGAATVEPAAEPAAEVAEADPVDATPESVVTPLSPHAVSAADVAFEVFEAVGVAEVAIASAPSHAEGQLLAAAQDHAAAVADAVSDSVHTADPAPAEPRIALVPPVAPPSAEASPSGPRAESQPPAVETAPTGPTGESLRPEAPPVDVAAARRRLAELDKVLAASPTDPDALFESARLHHALGDPELAARLYERLIESDPLNVGAHVNLAALVTEQGDLGRAESLLGEALALSPGSSAALVNLGNVHLRRGDLRLAELSYRQALRAEPGNALARLNLARTLERGGKLADAAAEIEILLASEQLPDTVRRSEVEAVRGRLALRRGRIDQAIVSLERAVALDPSRLGSRSDLAIAYLQEKKFARARKLLDEVIAKRPGDASAYVNRSLVSMGQGDLGSARRDLERAMQLDADSPDAHYNYAVLAERLGSFGFAIGEYERTLELDPHHARALNNLGRIYLKAARKKGDREEDRARRATQALDYLNKAAFAAPEMPEVHYNRGVTLIALNRRVEAASALERYLDLLPPGAERSAKLHEVLARLKR